MSGNAGGAEATPALSRFGALRSPGVGIAVAPGVQRLPAAACAASPLTRSTS
jgi:hypothetical protein